jgi:hypothetical protein
MDLSSLGEEVARLRTAIQRYDAELARLLDAAWPLSRGQVDDAQLVAQLLARASEDLGTVLEQAAAALG